MELGEISALKSLSVEVGSIFRMTLRPEDGVTPKNTGDTSRTKYFAVIGIEANRVMVASLLVNSRINDRLFNIIAPYQHRILPEDYPFMTKDESFFDCYRIKEIPMERILSDGEYIGLVTAEDLEAITALTSKSPANARIILEKYNLL